MGYLPDQDSMTVPEVMDDVDLKRSRARTNQGIIPQNESPPGMAQGNIFLYL